MSLTSEDLRKAREILMKETRNPPPQTDEEKSFEAAMNDPAREPVSEDEFLEALRQGKVTTVWNHPHDGKLRIFRPAYYGIGKSQPANGKEGA